MRRVDNDTHRDLADFLDDIYCKSTRRFKRNNTTGTSVKLLVVSGSCALLLLFSALNKYECNCNCVRRLNFAKLNQLSDDGSTTLLGCLLVFVTIINSFVCAISSRKDKILIRKKLNTWMCQVEKKMFANNEKDGGMYVSVLREDKFVEVPIYKIDKNDIIIDDGRLTSLLTRMGESCESRHSRDSKLIKMNESFFSFLTKELLRKSSITPLEKRICTMINIFDSVILPIFCPFSIIAALVAFVFSESNELYGDWKYVMGVSILSIIPILLHFLPFVCTIHLICDNAMISYLLTSNEDSSLFDKFKNLLKHLKEFSFSSINMCFHLSLITGVSSIDKNGLLSTTHPVLEKIFFLSTNQDEPCGEVLHVSADVVGDRLTSFSFDDPEWYRFMKSINAMVRRNDCILQDNKNSSQCLCPLKHLVEYHNVTQSKNHSISFKIIGSRCEDEDNNDDDISATCSVERMKNSHHSHIHFQGSPSLLLPLCQFYWDGDEVKPLTDRIARMTSNFATRHSITSDCYALTYSTISSPISFPLNDETFHWNGSNEEYTSRHYHLPSSSSYVKLERKIECVNDIMKAPQILIGLVSLQEQALPSIFSMIESLHSSCIRFILFSKENELRSRIIAEKLGLEAGWNCHISLKNGTCRNNINRFIYNKRSRHGSCPVVISTSFIPISQPLLPPNMARLPTGIQEIRPHLEEVDNVPLLVSLFTDCNTVSTREMIEILHAEDERELVLGSIYSLDNLILFLEGIYSIGVVPITVSGCDYNNSPCITNNNNLIPLFMSISTDHILHQSQISYLPNVLSFSRRRCSLYQYGLSFLFQSCISITLFSLLSLALILPFPISSFNTIILLFVIEPLLVLSISLNDDHLDRPSLPSSSIIILSSNITHLFFFHFPHFISLFTSYILLLTMNNHLPCLSPYGCEWIEPTNNKSNLSSSQVEYVISFLRVISLILSSTPFIYPYLSIFSNLPILNMKWTITSILSLLLQYTVSSIQLKESVLFSISPLLFIFYLSLSILSLVIAHTYKTRFVRIFTKENRRRKFGFDTKLGMNSPY